MGHSNIGLTMDLCGKVAGRMTLAQEQEARFEALAARALPAPVPVERETNSGTNGDTNSDDDPANTSDSQSTP